MVLSTGYPVPFIRMAAGSLLGFFYALLLPATWIMAAIVIMTVHVVESLARAAARSMAFGWRPIEAYLTGRKSRKADKRK